MQPQLKHLGLTQLEKALPALYELARQEQWTHETFMNRALAAEIEGRDRRAAERRMTAARLPTIKTLEAFDFTFQPDLSERLLWELADLSFVKTATNVVFLGPPGTGKTHLSLALTVKALSAGYSALFTTLTHLAEALDTASYPGLYVSGCVATPPQVFWSLMRWATPNSHLARRTTSLSWSPPAMSTARSGSPPIPAFLPGEVCWEMTSSPRRCSTGSCIMRRSSPSMVAATA